MADFQVTGFFIGCRHFDNMVIARVTENRNGYRKRNGQAGYGETVVWDVMFKSHFKDFIAKNIAKGSLVTVKGEVYPYGGKAKTGGFLTNDFVVLGQTINMRPYPYAGRDDKVRRESQRAADGTPDLAGFQKEDF